MQRIEQALEIWVFLLLAMFHEAQYWFDGVRIDLYASEEYRLEAIAAFNAADTSRADENSQIRALYDKRDFEALTVIVEQAEAETKAGDSQLALQSDMYIFNSDEDGKREHLDAWVERAPNSWVAHAARAEFLVGEGWRARGTKSVGKTTNEQFALMRVAFTDAEKDLIRTIELEPGYGGSYTNYLEIAKNNVGSRTVSEIMDMALAQDLGSYYLRYRYLNAVDPKWGGSYRQVRRFAFESQSEREQDPRVYSLLGAEHRMLANQARRDGDFEKCIEKFTKALEFGEFTDWRYGRAKCYASTERWDEQIADLEVVTSKTQEPSAYWHIAKAHAKMKRYDEALSNIEQAIALNATDPAYQNFAGWLHWTMGNKDSALRAFAEALAVDPQDTYAAEQAANIHLSRHDREKAVPYLEIAAHQGKNNPNSWYLYGDVLKHLDRPEHREALAKYLELADRNNQKESARIRQVERYLDGKGDIE